MPKALVSIVNTDIDDGNVRLIYSVVLFGPPHFKYGADFKVDPLISLEKNINALKDKIATFAGEKGTKISTGDVIIFGAPVVKDDVSFKDESKGITSDSTAVAAVADEPVAEDKGLIARMTQTVKDWFA